MTIEEAAREATLHDRAVTRLKKRHDFHTHLMVYALVNAFLVTIWAVTDAHAFFWPVFSIGGWGIAVILNAWDVYRNDELDEDRIQEEMERIQHQH
jgi:hypothetical protein